MSSHIRICIDNAVMFDGELDAWVAAPPDEFRDMLKPGAQPQPWMKAIMIAMTDAIMAGDSVNIEATTGDGFWSVEVTKTRWASTALPAASPPAAS